MQSEVDQLLELLQAHRRTTGLALIQRARFGQAHVAPSVEATIAEGRGAIKSVKEALQSQGYPVESVPIIDAANDMSTLDSDELKHLQHQLELLNDQGRDHRPQPWYNQKRFLIPLSFLLGVVLVLVIYVFRNGLQPAPLRVPIAIDSTKDWQSTGFMIVSGDKVTIRVVGGKWTSWRKLLPENVRNQLPSGIKSEFPAETWLNMSGENGGGGENRICAQCPVKRFNPSALVASIGNTKYGVGNSCGFKSISDGELFLRINDDDLSDNSGVLSVEITIGQSFDNINSQTCGIPVD